MNKVLLLGRIVKQPEVRYTSEKEFPYLKFVLAVNRKYVKATGERDADFVQVVLWGKRSESIVESLSRGRLVNVIGKLRTGNYENKEGVKRFFAEVEAEQINFLDTKDKREEDDEEEVS